MTILDKFKFPLKPTEHSVSSLSYALAGFLRKLFEYSGWEVSLLLKIHITSCS
jgi:hypothetical protein